MCLINVQRAITSETKRSNQYKSITNTATVWHGLVWRCCKVVGLLAPARIESHLLFGARIVADNICLISFWFMPAKLTSHIETIEARRSETVRRQFGRPTFQIRQTARKLSLIKEIVCSWAGVERAAISNLYFTPKRRAERFSLGATLARDVYCVSN